VRVDIDLLGRFSVAIDGRPVPDQAWRRRSAAAVVKLLALQPGRRLHREQLIDLLWPDLVVEQAAPRLHKAAHYARTALGCPGSVVLSGDVVTLFPDAQVVVDVDTFEETADAYRASGDRSCAEEAIALYRGDLLPDDTYEPWSDVDRQRLRVRYLEVLRLAERWSELVAAEPFDEEAHLRLVHQYVQDGDRGRALRHLDAMERSWREELGTRPGRDAQALRAEVQAMPAFDPARDRPLARGATRLPRPPTPTVGRERDIEAVLALLADHQVVTLLGVGGVGKTRLAAEVAHRYTEARSQRGCFVDLTKVREPGLVAELTVRELGIRAGASENVVPVLEEALRRQSLLLVLDNFEHVVDAADLVAAMTQWSDDLRVLVTSRARLRIASEQVFEVEPLAVEPEAGGAGLADAVALFEQVGSAVDPHFDRERHREDVVAICRSVDGLPLAIEIAAGHLRTLPPPLLRVRLADRLKSAAAVGRDVPHRQQTIPATIDWSLHLLDEAEQRLFTRLAIFNGAVPLDAVESVCADGADVVDALSRLVDQSLVRRRAGHLDEPRYGMLELVREHAQGLLGDEADTVAARHAAYVAAFIADLDDRRWTDAADRWVDDINEMLGEVRAAHDWASRRGDVTLGARITAGLGTYWHLEGHQAEGRRWVDEMLAHEAELEDALTARIRLAAGFLEWPRNQLDARAHWQRATELCRRLGDSRLLAYALAVKSATYVGDHEGYARAMQLNDEALGLARQAGAPGLVAQVLNVRGELSRVAGDDALARAAYEEGLELSEAAGDESYVSVLLANLSYLADHRGEYDEARRLDREALRICWSHGRRLMAAWTVSELAGPEHGLGRSERGAVLIGAADDALRVLGSRRHPGDLPEYHRVVAALRAALGDERYERLYAEGARMSLEDAVALALDEEAPRRLARASLPADA
jgi:predicted ATPase/DNA-binding SARP family transcriptional activator